MLTTIDNDAIILVNDFVFTSQLGEKLMSENVKVKVKGVSMFPHNWEKVKDVMRENGFDSMSQTLRHIVKQYGKNETKVLTPSPKGA